ncbi:MAG TPA: hypothetical protein VFT15_12325 [Chitinophagaceae bacterium]|nr:hypothetical protein [Chitinophagaceae bacterium]
MIKLTGTLNPLAPFILTNAFRTVLVNKVILTKQQSQLPIRGTSEVKEVQETSSRNRIRDS